MFGRSAHPDDGTLFALGATADPEIRAHVDSCPTCRARTRQLEAIGLDVSDAAAREVDTLFPPARWAKQRAHILMRLAHLGEPARILPFPGRRVVAPRLWARYGWMAGSAAAGLVLGVLGGSFLVIDRDLNESPVRTAVTAPASVDPAGDRASFSSLEDEMFLLELDAALDARGCEELRVLDDLTPLARPDQPLNVLERATVETPPPFTVP